MPGPLVFRSFLLRFLSLVIAVICCCYGQAQLCNGSLGDPVVNITFGAGSSGPGYAPDNSYEFTPARCPTDGHYTITNSISSCFDNSWHSIVSDHTGNGNFMLVNASFSPGDFFVTTVSDLCPGTTYEFAAWIMNVQIPFGIRPNITFSIETPDGMVLKQFESGNIDISGRWKQYGSLFTTPPVNARIVLRMTNNAPGGYGNDLALDDITFRPCGPMIKASILDNADTVDVCADKMKAYIFQATVSSSYQSPGYQWQISTDSGVAWNDIPGATSITYQGQPAPGVGGYWYRLTVIDGRFPGLTTCRIASNSVVINVHPDPIVDAGPDKIVLAGDFNTLNGKAEGENPRHTWTPADFINDVASLTPTIFPVADINYLLSAVSLYGCSATDQVSVKVVGGIYVPTAFTPNGDGKNDDWRIPFLDPSFNATVRVYNRHGRLVYQSTGTSVDWDGTVNKIPQASGVYVYLVTFKTRKLKLKGTVTLIR